MRFVGSICLAFVLDLLIGDPTWIPHPVVLMGKCISTLEKFLRGIFPKTPKGEIVAGRILAAVLPLGTFVVTAVPLYVLRKFSPWAAFALNTFWCMQALAVKGMLQEGRNVAREVSLAETFANAPALIGANLVVDTESGQLRREDSANGIPGPGQLRREGSANDIPGPGQLRREGSANDIPGPGQLRREGSANDIPGSGQLRREGSANDIPGSGQLRREDSVNGKPEPGQPDKGAKTERARAQSFEKQISKNSAKTADIWDDARKAVGRIVGRDTAALDKAGIIRAAVETVAENFSDGVFAPLMYMVIGGAPLALTYKAINTMDSMVGYKNKKYLYFGRAAAKLDDVANLIPARLAALVLILSVRVCEGKTAAKNAFRIWRRDRLKHPSPNSAQTESVMAGALGVRLLGPTRYFGRLYEKEWIGDDTREIETRDIGKACHIFMIGSVISLVILIGMRILCLLVLEQVRRRFF